MAKKPARRRGAPKPVGKQPLTEQQRVFCLHVVKGMTASEAARKAGYSHHTAGPQGSRLLKSPRIQAEIARIRKAANRPGSTGGPADPPAETPSRDHDAEVNKLLKGAIEGAAANPRAVQAAELDLRQAMDAEVAAAISADYLDAALVENLEICLGRRKTTVVKVIGRGTKAVSKEVQVFDRDPRAANAAIEQLHRRLVIRRGEQPPGAHVEDLPGHVREAIRRFRRVARGEEEE